MLSRGFFLVFTLFFQFALAAEMSLRDELHFRVSPIAYEQRYEASTDPLYVDRNPRHLGLGIKYERHIVSMEYSTFSDKSGNETYRVERRFQDVLVWYHNAWFERKALRLVAGIGAGIYDEEVVTYFYDIKNEQHSGSKWTTGIGVGAEYQVFSYLVLGLEGRLIAGQNIDNNPQPVILSRLSFQF